MAGVAARLPAPHDHAGRRAPRIRQGRRARAVDHLTGRENRAEAADRDGPRAQASVPMRSRPPSRPRRTACAGWPKPRPSPCPRCWPSARRRPVVSMIPPGRADAGGAPSGSAPTWPSCTRPARPGFGAPWPGFIASLPLDNTPLPDAAGDWAAVVRTSAGCCRSCAGPWHAGALRPEDARLVEAVIDRIGSVAGPAEPPSRIHGDCWAGNVLWSGGRGWLIDPAAHGGHRETDLAMLALFGAPGPGPDPGGYHEAVPLAAGLAIQDPAAPAASAAGARVPVRRLLPGRGPVRGPRRPGPLAPRAGSSLRYRLAVRPLQPRPRTAVSPGSGVLRGMSSSRGRCPHRPGLRVDVVVRRCASGASGRVIRNVAPWPWAVPDRGDAAVGGHQRGHDRQAQPAAAGLRVRAWSAR